MLLWFPSYSQCKTPGNSSYSGAMDAYASEDSDIAEATSYFW